MADKNEDQQHHHGFSVAAHNEAMDILYASDPSDEEIQRLIELAHVARWHWSKRTDKKPQNISVALWLLSRAYAANGFGEPALAYATESFKVIEHEGLLPSFYGYSNEALARAHALLGNSEDAKRFLNKAIEITETVQNAQAKQYLMDQINRIHL